MALKILCVADIHQEKEIWENIESAVKKHKPDVLINAGDFMDRGDARKAFDRANIKTFFVHGNWDVNLKTKNGKVTVMNNMMEEYGGYHFLGVDSRYFLGKEMYEITKDIDPKKLILITHEPPYGILDLSFFGNNAGLLEFREFAETKGPVLHVFGHIHESAGVLEHGRTLFINAAVVERRRAYMVTLPKRSVKEIKV